MDHERRLQTLRALQRALDEQFSIPGTRVRFGWDPIVGLVPWAGDALTALFACAIVIQAHQLGVPRVAQLRMLMNIAFDLLLGVIPVAGDIADVFWKANTRNMAILERHAGQPKPASLTDWLFVGGVLLAIVALALLPVLAFYLLVRLVVGVRA